MSTRAVWLLSALPTAVLAAALAAGCRASNGDACDAYHGMSCIALLVQSPAGLKLSVDQIALSADLGYLLDGTLDPASPHDPAVALPVTMPLIPSADFSGDFSLFVVGMLQGTAVGSASTNGSVVVGKHQRLAVTLTPPGGALDGGAADLAMPDLAQPRPLDLAGLDLAGADLSVVDLATPIDQALPTNNIGPSTDVAENVLATWMVSETPSDAMKPCNPGTLGTVSLAADTTKKKVGTEAVRVDYGPDTHFYFDAAYPKTRDGRWNLTGRTGLQFWTTGLLPTSYTAWQPVAPELILCGHGGGYRKLSPTTNHEPRNAADPYVQLQIPLAGSVDSIKTDVGAFDLADVDALEIHLDPQQMTATTGAETQVWFDGVQFYP